MIGGIVLLATGNILVSCIHFLEEPESVPGYYSGGSNDEERAYEQRVNLLNGFGKILAYVGMSVMSVGVILSALLNDKIPKSIRLGLLIVLGVVLGIQMKLFSIIS